MDKHVEHYQQLHEIHLDDGRIFYIPSTGANSFVESWNKDRAVRIGASWIAARKISEVKESNGSWGIEKFPIEIRQKVQERKNQFYASLKKYPSNEKVLEWARRAMDGEDIMAKVSHREDKAD